MDAVSTIAAAGQIASGVSHIVSLLLELRDEIKQAPLRLREKVDYLDSFIFVLKSIQDHLSLQNPKVKAQIEGLEDKVTAIRLTLQQYSLTAANGSSLARRAFAAISAIKAKEKLLRSFEALDRQKGLLDFYIIATSGETLHHLVTQASMPRPSESRQTTRAKSKSPSSATDEGYASDVFRATSVGKMDLRM